MQYKTLFNLFQNTPELCQFVDKLTQLEQINHIVSAQLEPTLASQCCVANIRDGSLILSTKSPAWNHKLRFASIELLSKLRSYPAWSGLKSIEVRIDYLPTTTTPINNKPNKSLCISKANAELLQATAQNISCKNLANSLQRLAEKAN